MFQQDGVCFCPVVADSPDDLNEVTERVFGIGRPLVEGNNDAFVLEFSDLVGPDVKVAVFVVGWHELIDIEWPAFFLLCLHCAVLR